MEIRRPFFRSVRNFALHVALVFALNCAAAGSAPPLPAAAEGVEPAEPAVSSVIAPAPVSGGDAAFARCVKILTYGDSLSRNPSKTDAVIALGLLGDERAVPVLIEHLQNQESPHLRFQIAKALGWLGRPQAVPALEAALTDPSPYLRQQAALALKAITGKEYTYDRSGLPDIAKLRDALRSAPVPPDSK